MDKFFRWLKEKEGKLKPARFFTWIFLLALLGNLLTVCILGLNSPPYPGDGQDYDSLALNLLRGRGFGYFNDDPEWRKPYEEHNAQGLYQDILARHGEFVSSTSRPPAYPLLLAALYKIFGRQFWIAYAFNALIFAFAIALTAVLALKIAGLGVGMIAAGLALLDPSFKFFSAQMLTEALACLGVVALLWVLLKIREQKKLRYVLYCGFILGILFLTRSIFIFWYPFVFFLVLWCWGRKRTWLALTLFILTSLALPVPWMVRNCQVMDGFMPLGDQGGVKLPGGFCDAAYKAKGVWQSETEGGYFVDFYRDPQNQSLSFNEKQRALAHYGTQKAKEWVRNNPQKAVVISLYKLRSLWLWAHGYTLPLLALALLGSILYVRNGVTLLLWSIIMFNSVPVMATWDVNGRFLVPVIMPLEILAAIGVFGFLKRVHRNA